MENVDTIRVVKWFWAWQDEREEAWLGEMARRGWRLSALPFPLFYEFTAGAPSDDVYRLDYQRPSQKTLGDYEQLFRDAGWELVGTMSGWHYFRKSPQPGEPTEIYTDAESKIAKYQRLSQVLMGIFAPQFVLFIILSRSIERMGAFGPVFFLVYMTCFALYFVTMLGLMRRVKQLKAQRGVG
jgi:hypothetical protein